MERLRRLPWTILCADGKEGGHFYGSVLSGPMPDASEAGGPAISLVVTHLLGVLVLASRAEGKWSFGGGVANKARAASYEQNIQFGGVIRVSKTQVQGRAAGSCSAQISIMGMNNVVPSSGMSPWESMRSQFESLFSQCPCLLFLRQQFNTAVCPSAWA
jgi:hypothetical protein